MSYNIHKFYETEKDSCKSISWGGGGGKNKKAGA